MPRRKPASGKQRKAQLQVKRAVKRGDATPELTTTASRPSTRRRGAKRNLKLPVRGNVDASRRLESSFVKFSPEVLQDAKHKASNLVLERPISPNNLLFPRHVDEDGSNSVEDHSQDLKLTLPRRPKWRYDMSKKDVESNEAACFKRWLDETDRIIQAWKADVSAPQNCSHRSDKNEDSGVPPSESRDLLDDSERMAYAAPLFERNLEVWRQLWRVIEICEVLLVLLDSRCPLLHYPPSLESYLSSFRPSRKVIFVLTKVDIAGPQISALWKEYLCKNYPTCRVVIVESYLKRAGGEGQGQRIIREPNIPADLKKKLVRELKDIHKELCSPPPRIASDASRLESWNPPVVPVINWDAVLEGDFAHEQPLSSDEDDEGEPGDEDEDPKEFLSIGLIGQPNVGKSSLLNALFGRHKVKASKTPGKTKHFQTLFWSKQIRLVDCPGLVFPSFSDLEMQVLAGVLPISQIPAIPSSIYHALQYIPLEGVLALQHPAEKEDAPHDKRTWRAGMRPIARANVNRSWTAMDVLTALAEKNNWITAKAGRPDVNRAGNYILRVLAEGRIRWAFYPPDTDLSTLAREYKGQGIWIEGGINGHIVNYGDLGDDSDGPQIDSENETASVSESEHNSSDSEIQAEIATGTGMFSVLTMVDDGGFT